MQFLSTPQGTALIGLACLLSATAAVAQDPIQDQNYSSRSSAGGASASGVLETGSYAGGSLGQYRYEDSSLDDDNFEDDSESYKAFLGARLNRVFSIEAGYNKYGEVEDQGRRFEADGIPLSISAALPLSPGFAPYAKLGQLYWDLEGEGNSEIGNENIDGNDTFYGVGAWLNLSRNLNMRLEYERFELDDADLDMATAGLALQF